MEERRALGRGARWERERERGREGEEREREIERSRLGRRPKH
jgi:hypothetical protein